MSHFPVLLCGFCSILSVSVSSRYKMTVTSNMTTLFESFSFLCLYCLG